MAPPARPDLLENTASNLDTNGDVTACNGSSAADAPTSSLPMPSACGRDDLAAWPSTDYAFGARLVPDDRRTMSPAFEEALLLGLPACLSEWSGVTAVIWPVGGICSARASCFEAALEESRETSHVKPTLPGVAGISTSGDREVNIADPRL
jgi:hypothetical protein